MTTLASLFTINLISVAIGTFAANFGLLWLIGERARKANEEYARLVNKLQVEATKRYDAEVKKRQEYLKMES